MAVRAHDFALLYLLHHAAPALLTDPMRHAEFFIALMVELENDYVRLAAVHTWMAPKVPDDQLRTVLKHLASIF